MKFLLISTLVIVSLQVKAKEPSDIHCGEKNTDIQFRFSQDGQTLTGKVPDFANYEAKLEKEAHLVEDREYHTIFNDKKNETRFTLIIDIDPNLRPVLKMDGYSLDPNKELDWIMGCDYI